MVENGCCCELPHGVFKKCISAAPPPRSDASGDAIDPRELLNRHAEPRLRDYFDWPEMLFWVSCGVGVSVSIHHELAK